MAVAMAFRLRISSGIVGYVKQNMSLKNEMYYFCFVGVGDINNDVEFSSTVVSQEFLFLWGRMSSYDLALAM